MRWNKHIVFIVVALALSGAVRGLAASSANLQMTAQVLPFVSFQAVQHVSSYQVSKADLERGYVDLPASLTVHVRTNLSAGVPVFFESNAGTRVLIRESGASQYSSHSFTLDTDRYRPNTPISKSYDFRVLLSNEAKDGARYPLAISMAPTI